MRIKSIIKRKKQKKILPVKNKGLIFKSFKNIHSKTSTFYNRALKHNLEMHMSRILCDLLRMCEIKCDLLRIQE